ncbi:MAG TPA: hypothetical protein VKV41_12840, partial [Methylomirabilota bacterium]|nr:hypothetical protein [Methylomirabilota bacterium]
MGPARAVLLTLGCLLGAAAPALAQATSDIQRCLTEKEPDAVINYCGRAFRSAQLSHSNRSEGHLARG